MRFFLLPVLLLLTGASPERSSPVGTLGSVRYTLGSASSANQSPDSELLSLSGGAAEFLAPLNSFSELDRLAFLSHSATNLCGSIDYFPLGYTLAETQTHAPSYLSTELYFPALSSLITAVDLDQMNQTLATLTALPSRFHRHSTGQNAGAAVKQIWASKLNTTLPSTFSLAEITHVSTPQKSVVATLPGDSEETVILGSHLDTINSEEGIEGLSPGADDDGSGVAILTEILRIVEANGLRFHRRIELHAYAAEEIGLVGSRELAVQYKREGKAIAGMLQFDMAYYSQPADLGRLFFLENYTSLDLTRNAIRLTKRYIGDVYDRGVLPLFAASDHRSWWEQGYPALFPFENPTADNPSIHTAKDTILQFDDGLRMKRMVQLGLLFLSYQAGLKTLDAEAPAEVEKLRTTKVAKDLFLNLEGARDSYTLSASTPATAAYLEICRIENAGDFRCLGPRLKLTKGVSLSGRNVFAAKLSFAGGEKYRVEAFDASDTLIARRHISLEIKDLPRAQPAGE
ncbi:MAG: M20/M25/M40 family metallo-hydrolase [Bdellovibrionota bacterium]